jgi:hypothetical protein
VSLAWFLLARSVRLTPAGPPIHNGSPTLHRPVAEKLKVSVASRPGQGSTPAPVPGRLAGSGTKEGAVMEDVAMKMLRFRVRSLMIAVIAAAFLFSTLRLADSMFRDFERMINYNNGPDEARLSIGQRVVTYRQDSPRTVVRSQKGEYLVPVGTHCTVTDETKGDLDTCQASRGVGVRIDEGAIKGKVGVVTRRYLRAR